MPGWFIVSSRSNFKRGLLTTSPASASQAFPRAGLGTVQLGSRVILPGDILTTGQLDAMTFHPASAGGQEAQLTYLPIYGNRVEKEAVMTISIRSKENQAPVAESTSLETYKNLEATGTLTATDPEGGS